MKKYSSGQTNLLMGNIKTECYWKDYFFAEISVDSRPMNHFLSYQVITWKIIYEYAQIKDTSCWNYTTMNS